MQTRRGANALWFKVLAMTQGLGSADISVNPESDARGYDAKHSTAPVVHLSDVPRPLAVKACPGTQVSMYTCH